MTWKSEHHTSYAAAWAAVAHYQARGYVCTCPRIDGWGWTFTWTPRIDYMESMK